MSRSSARKGPEAFDAYYQTQFGGRWPSLKEALLANKIHTTYREGLLCDYQLDEASLFCASALPLDENFLVADLCAAPGGKTLVLATRLPRGAQLIANEFSTDRRHRLRRVLEEHLPRETLSRVRVTGEDARNYGLRHSNQYDAILLDAPCSSERHLLHSAPHLCQWGYGRTKNLSIQAGAMAAAAFDSLKAGGYLLYSTCALSVEENDKVWDKMETKRQGWRSVALPEGPGEPTKWGRLVLPDTSGGIGPLYMVLIQKLPEAPE